MSATVRRGRFTDRTLGSLLLLPTFAVLGVFVFYPLGKVAWLSTQRTNVFGQPSGFVGLRNFVSVVADPSFAAVMLQTAAFCLGVVVGRLLLGLLIVVPLTAKVRGRRVFQALLTSPMVVSVSAASVAFAAMLAPGTGLLSVVVSSLGGSPPSWLASPVLALPCVVLATVWGSLGFTVLLLLGAFGALDASVIEAARLDGAGSVRILRSISLPLVTPTLFFVVVTGSVEALTAFGQIQILTRGGPAGSSTTLVYEIYQQAFGSAGASFGLASALGMVLFVLVLVLALSLLQFGVLERRVHYA